MSLRLEEEEKILLLRLNSRGITEVEQTDVQVKDYHLTRVEKIGASTANSSYCFVKGNT